MDDEKTKSTISGLINCPSCGTEISSTAEQCYACGRQMVSWETAKAQFEKPIEKQPVARDKSFEPQRPEPKSKGVAETPVLREEPRPAQPVVKAETTPLREMQKQVGAQKIAATAQSWEYYTYFKATGVKDKSILGVEARTPIKEAEIGENKCPRCKWRLVGEIDTCYACGYTFRSEEKAAIKPRDAPKASEQPEIKIEKKMLSEEFLPCPKCGRKLEPKAVFCYLCGHKITAEERAAALAPKPKVAVEPKEKIEEKLTCPKCAHKLDKDAKFCYACGHKLKEEMKKVIRMPPAEPEVAKVEEKKVFCPACTVELKESDTICYVCGYKFSDEELKRRAGVPEEVKPRVKPEVPKPSEPEKKPFLPEIKCEHCGTMLPEKAVMCYVCGSKISLAIIESQQVEEHEEKVPSKILRLGREKLKECNERLAKNPDDIEALFEKGNALAEMGEYYDALNVYDEVIKKSPNHMFVWSAKAHALNKIGRTTEAAKCYRRAMEITLARSPVSIDKLLEAVGETTSYTTALDRALDVLLGPYYTAKLQETMAEKAHRLGQQPQYYPPQQPTAQLQCPNCSSFKVRAVEGGIIQCIRCGHTFSPYAYPAAPQPQCPVCNSFKIRQLEDGYLQCANCSYTFLHR